MKKDGLKLSASENSKIYQLMSNFESRLDMLTKDQCEYESQALNQSQQINYSMISPQKSQLRPEDLANSRQSMPSSPILSKISQMEEQYLSKLTVLNQKVTFLECQNSQLKELGRSLQSQLTQAKQRLEVQERNQQRIVDERIDELKDNLMQRLRQEVEVEVQGYIQELKQMRQQLTAQRKQKKRVEKELQILTFQRDNFQQLYKEIMSKYKMLMKADIQGYQHQKQQLKTMSFNGHQDQLYGESRNRNESKNSENMGVSKKKKVSRKNKSEKEPQTMPKEQLIPFLTKGIEELKEKLKLK